MVHKLKILPQYFDAVADGRKPFEVRRNDRDYKVGDTLLLREGNKAEDVIEPPECPCYNNTDHCPGCIFGNNMEACPDLREYNQAMEDYEEQTENCWIYTGRELRCEVLYILQGGVIGIEQGYCVLGITLMAENI